MPVAKVAYKAAYEAAGKQKMLGGPDWSNADMSPDKMQWWIDGAGVKGMLNMITVRSCCHSLLLAVAAAWIAGFCNPGGWEGQALRVHSAACGR